MVASQLLSSFSGIGTLYDLCGCYFISNESCELLLSRLQLRVKPITSHVLNAHMVAVLYLHQTMLHSMEFCTANTTFHSFSRKREATTI